MADDRRLIYVHDPMCSWCWGFAPTLARLREQLPEDLVFERLLGGLAPDSDQPMPEAMQLRLQHTWRRIQERIPGTRFNFAFWEVCQPRRSTWPACRAVIVARQLDPMLEATMIGAIQHAYYLEARNPSDIDTLASLAAGLGLDADDFSGRLEAPETHERLAREIRESRRIGANGFPSLRLKLGDSVWPVPVDYRETAPMLEAVRSLLDG